MPSTRSLAGGAVAGLLLLSACGVGAQSTAAGSTGIRTIELDTVGMRFVPDHIDVRLHETVRFVVRNTEATPHEVFIGTEAEQMAHHALHASTAPQAQQGIQHYGYGAYLPGFGTVEFDYRFDLATEIIIGCHLPGHWEAGMKAAIFVSAS